MTMEVRVARVYDQATARDGYRVLVDRLWPRGISKAVADLDEWCREVAPSAPLRQWYGHVPDRFPEFRQRYRSELSTGDATDAFRAAADACHEVAGCSTYERRPRRYTAPRRR